MDQSPAQRRIENLQTLLEVSRQLGAGIELLPLLLHIEQAVLRVLDCERATVFLYDRSSNELYSKVATGGADIRFPADLGIAGETAQSGSTINVPDAYADPRFNPEVDRLTGFTTRSLLTFPLTGYDGAVVGVLQALNRRGGPFTSADESLAVTLSSLAGVAVQRQMLLEEYAVKQRLQRDLAVAREIQQSLLPSRAPNVQGYSIAGWNRPADETGGDCFDFVPLEGGKWGLMLADATGHGIGPALCVSECRALLRACISDERDLVPGLRRANAILHQDLPDGRFVTAFFGVLDPRQHRVDYASAGHGPILVHRKADDHRVALPADTFPLAVAPDIPLAPPDPIRLKPGDTLLLVTDGFFEWTNPASEQFGTERILDLARDIPDAPAADLIEALHHAVVDFAQGTPQGDDLTAIAVRRG